MVVFATFIKGRMPSRVFLGLIECICGKKNSTFMYKTLISTLKDWRLDLSKFLGFGSNGASIMVGFRIGVAI